MEPTSMMAPTPWPVLIEWGVPAGAGTETRASCEWKGVDAVERPNILWICTDQQRYDTLGCYGNPWVRTPNIDGLAGEGTRFEFAFCQNPLCTPSRASFLTGRYPRTTRARQNGQSIPADAILVTK